MAVKWFRIIVVISFLCIADYCCSQSPLDRKFSGDYNGLPVSGILDNISERGGFNFSYNPDAIDVDRVVTIRIEAILLSIILDSLFKEQVEYTAAGNYVVILPKSEIGIVKRKAKSIPRTTITGTIVDSRTGRVVSSVSIYQVGENYSTLSEYEGTYTLHVPKIDERIGIRYSKRNYIDTVIILQPDESVIDVLLRPNEKLKKLPLQEIKRIEANHTNAVEHHSITRLIVPQEQVDYSNNFDNMSTGKLKFLCSRL
ncbi:MAG: hypothetical protein JKY42_07575 [Flavobacteriales bacterium]|nr:hypothetical protein [Flavobacteriales bacterium]